MKRRKILLVENDPVLAVLSRLELETLGYDVFAASEGLDAIKMAEESHPDIVLMDFQLDGDLDGAQTADEIQTRFQIPVVFLTGCSDWPTVQKCLTVKPYGYVRKPCRQEDLQEAIEHAAFQRDLLERFQEIEKNPFHDALTGLSNRRFFLEKLRIALESGPDFALLYIDIDRLKRINDGSGYSEGDRFLQLFAARLEAARRRGDCVARIGTDEFAVLLNDVHQEQDALDYASHIHLLMNSPFILDSKEIFATLGIGITHSCRGYQNVEDVLRDAESAVYQAKEQGTSSTAIFDKEMFSQTMEFFHLENDLRRAIERGELAVYYQPIMRLEPYGIAAFEALLRWNHPQQGLIGATEIIPVAEKAGLILPIGRWVMEEACKQLAEWQAIAPELTMHVNLSSKHLLQENLLGEIERILDLTGIKPASLKIEITEDFVLSYTEAVLKTLHALESLNIGLQIDDFGKGYSSLRYLHQFPIETLKIDHSFIERVDSGPESLEIVGMIVNLGKKLHLNVIAEGVETCEQLGQIQGAGCQLVQGYLFSVPVNAEHAKRLLLDLQTPFAA